MNKNQEKTEFLTNSFSPPKKKREAPQLKKRGFWVFRFFFGLF